MQDLIAQGTPWNNIIYINFEDERLVEFTTQDFNSIITLAASMSDGAPIYFFDEIQNVSGWEKFARRLADSFERVYITGSNAKMLSHDIATTLGGRYLTLHVEPYNFREYCQATGLSVEHLQNLTTKVKGKLLHAQNTYLAFGGLPEAPTYLDKRSYFHTASYITYSKQLG
ncbi:Uncharacterised protein [Arcanobacterium haemolyticum]|nr:Uncharacterised protein [Arcanobacterium haemolyticum]